MFFKFFISGFIFFYLSASFAGPGEPGGLFDHPLFRRQAVQNQAEIPVTGPSPIQARPAQGFEWPPRASSSTAVAEHSAASDVEGLDCYWNGHSVVIRDTDGIEKDASPTAFEFYRDIVEAQSTNLAPNLLDVDALPMRTHAFVEKLFTLKEVVVEGVELEDVIGMNVYDVVEMCLATEAQGLRYVNKLARSILGNEYLALLKDTYLSKIVPNENFLSYVPMTDEGFDLLEETVLEGTSWAKEGTYQIMLEHYRKIVCGNEALSYTYRQKIQNSLLLAQANIEYILIQALLAQGFEKAQECITTEEAVRALVPRPVKLSKIQFEDCCGPNPPQLHGKICCMDTFHEYRKSVIENVLAQNQDGPRARAVEDLREYSYGTEESDMSSVFEIFEFFRQTLENDHSWDDAPVYSAFANEKDFVGLRPVNEMLEAFSGGTFEEFIWRQILCPISGDIALHKVAVNDLKVGGDSESSTLNRLGLLMQDHLNDTVGSDWRETNPQEAILTDPKFLRRVFVRDGMVAQ